MLCVFLNSSTQSQIFVKDLDLDPSSPNIFSSSRILFIYQSLSDEDSFKKMSSTKEVLEKIQELLSHLVERWDTFVVYLKPFIENTISNVVFCLKSRMHKDGRLPQTFRLTIRRYSATNKWFSRESRQAPIPNHVAQKIPSGKLRDTATRAPEILCPHPDVQMVFCHVCRQPG